MGKCSAGAMTHQEELVRSGKAEGSLDCNNHEMAEFQLLKSGCKAHSRTPTPDAEQVSASLGICLAGSCVRLPWRAKRPRQLVHLHGPPPPRTRMGHCCLEEVKQVGQNLASFNRECLTELRCKKEIHRRWKWAQAACEYWRGIA